MTGNLYVGNHRVINVEDPVADTDAGDKQYLEQSHIKPTHKTDQFANLMKNKLEWTDMYGSSFNMVKTADLLRHDGNPHTYNHKVIYTTINKNSDGNFDYKLGRQYFTLQKLKIILSVLSSLTQITNYGIRVLFPLIKPHHMG